MAEDLNLKTVETVDTRPFRKLVMTIGELPTSFIESMTYYELLAWFTNYLETVIIPTVNNNGEAVEELQEKYVELKNNTEQEIDDFENEMTTAFNTLKDFVDNYFDNLDVQEEINNKLDEMAEDGILQEIITTYIQSNVAWTFDTVADMKLATNLVNGSFAQTLGFYSRDDKGGALYKITDTGTANEMDVIAIGSTLFAHLVPQNIMNVKQFGAKGDGLTDDTLAIQTSLDFNNNINVPTGTYMINAVTRISLNTNNKIILDNDATIKAITNAEDHYEIIYIDNVSNVEISGGTIEGDRETHTGTSGEWGQCISVSGGADHIYIHDITLKNGWGDGIYFNTCSNVTTSRVHVDNVRRNGYSIIAATNFLSEDDVIENTNGTAPQSGIDIEPNTSANVLDNVVFNRLTTKNNANKGFMIAFGNTIENTTPYNITINDMFSDGDDCGVYFEIPSTTITGNIYVNHPTVINSKRWGIAASNYNYSVNCKVVIDHPIVKSYAHSQTSTTGGIYFQSQSNHEGGNVFIKNPIVTTPSTYSSTQTAAISLTGRGTSYPWHYFVLEDPLDLGGLGITIGQSTYLNISDKLELTRLDITANTTLKNDYHSLVTNTGATGSVRATIAQNTTVKNQVITFRVVENQNMVLRFTDQYIYPLSSSISQDVTLSGVGTSITIKKISDTEWVVLNQIGNVTV